MKSKLSSLTLAVFAALLVMAVGMLVGLDASTASMSFAAVPLFGIPESSALAAYRGMTMMATSPEMDALTEAVTENTTLDDSVVTFLNGVADQIAQAAGDKAKSLELAQTLRDKSAAVSTALAANTPAEPGDGS